MQSSRPRNTTHCIPVGREPTGSPPPLMDEDEFRWDYDEGEETEVIRELNYAQLDLWSPQFLSRRQNAREQQTVLTYRQIAGDYWTRGIDQADIMRANETDVNIDGRPIPSNRSDRLCVSSTLATSYGIPGMRRRVEWEDHSNTADTSEKVWDAVINGSTLRKLMPKPCKKFGRAEQMENLIRARQQGCGPLGSTETDMKDALSWTWYGYFQSDDRSLQMSLVQNPDPAQYLEDSQRELQTNWNLFGGPHTQYILMNRMRCSTTEFTPIWPTMYRYGPIIEQAAPQPQDKCSYGFHYGCACYGRWIDVTRYYAIVRKEEHIWDWVLSNCGWEPMMPIIVCDMHRDHGLYGKGSGIIGRALRFPTDDGHTWYHDLKADQLTASEALMLDALYCYCLQAVQYRTLLTMISEPVSESARLKPSESYWDAVIDAYGDEGERIFRLHYAEMERITWSAPPEMVDNASKERLPINAEFMEGSTLGAKLRTLKKTNLLTVLSTPIEEPHDVEQADVPDSRLQEVLDQQSVDYHNRSQRSGVGHPEREPLLWRDNLNHRNILSWGAVTKALDALSTIIIFFFLVIFTGYVLCNIPGANAETISGIPTGTPVPEFNFTVPLALAPPKVELEEEIPLTLGEWWSSRPEGYFWNLTQPYVEMIMGPVQKWFDNSVLTPKMLSMVVLPILCAFIPRPQIAVMLWAMLGYLVRNDMVEMARFLVSFSFFLFFERLRNPSRFWVTITYSICLHILEASYTMPLKQAFVAITVSLTITLACILFASVTRLVKENALLLIDRSYPIFTWGVFLFGMLTSWYGILVIALVAVISALFVVVRGSNKFVQQIDHVVGTNRPVYGAIRRVYPTILGAPWVDKVIFGVDTESAQGVRFVPGDVIHGVVSEGANRPWSWWNWFLFILGYEPKFYLPEDSSSSQLAVHSATETEVPEQRLKADSVQSTPVIGTMDPVLVTKPGPSRKNSIPSSSTSSPLPDYPYMTEKELRGVLAKFLAPHVAVGDISPADAMKMGNTVFRIIMALDKQENEGARSHPVDLITAAFESWDGKNRKQSHRMRRLNQKEVEDWAQDFIDDQDVAAWEDDYSFNNDYNDPGDGNIKIGRRKARKMRAPPVHEHAPRVIRESAFDNNVLMKSAGYEKYRIYEKAPNWIGVPENVSEENIEEFAAEFGSEWIGRRPPFDSCWVHGEGAIMGELITTLQAEAAMKKSEFFPGDPGVVVEIVTEKGDLMGTGFVYCGCIHTIRHVIDVPDTPQFMRAHFADKSFKIYPLGKAIGYVPYVSPSWANVAHVKEGDWIFRAPQQWFHDLTLLKTPLHTTRLIPFPSGAPLGQVRARIDQYPQNLPGPLFGPTSSPGDAWFDGRHTCSTNGASSGGPLRLFEGTKVTDKVIGVHCGAAGPSLNFFIPFDEKTIQAIDAVCKGQTKIPEPGRVDLPESADPLAEWEARLVQAAWVEGVMPDIGQMTTEQVARFLKTMEKFPFVHPKKPDQKLPEQAKPTQLPTASTETQAPPQPKTKKEKGKQVKTPAQSEESIRAEFAKLQKAHAKLKRRLEKKSPKSGNGGGPSSSGPHQPQQPPQQGAGAMTNHH